MIGWGTANLAACSELLGREHARRSRRVTIELYGDVVALLERASSYISKGALRKSRGGNQPCAAIIRDVSSCVPANERRKLHERSARLGEEP